MKVLITGTSTGMGRATAWKFLKEGHQVIGLDIREGTISQDGYTHYICDVSERASLPAVDDVEILVNNAGVQQANDIDVNLRGVINCTMKYGMHKGIKSVVNQASVSAHNGAEFGEYVASKGGVLAYTKWTAKEIAVYGATANSISFGGVSTELNSKVMDDGEKWDEIMSMTPLGKWVSTEEAAEWIYFLAVMNKSMTAQDIVVDNGEMYNHKFIW